MKYYLLLLLLFSQFCAADCEQASDSCAAVGEWKFSLSVGAGVYTNPLHGGDNIPLILIPKISYYGEQVFFENNTLGYTLRYDVFIILSLLPVTIGLFFTSRRGFLQADSILVLILASLLAGPFISMLTEFYFVLPYRFLPLIVFVAIGIGVFLSKKN